MTKRRDINVFNIAFLDLLSGALGAVIILYITVPKNQIKDLKATEQVSAVKIVEEDDAKQKIIALQEEIAGLTKYNKKLEGKLDTLKEENKTLIKSEEELRAVIKKDEEIDKSKNVDIDVGFKFRGKYIVFIIDVSGSMYKEDRIGQVKAGLKMLITSMSEDFYIDVLNFPHATISNFRPLWGHFKKTTQYNKDAIYMFLQDLKPYGATPTRSVLKHVLQNYNYITDIVILSDGAPTKSNSKDLDDIPDVLKEIRYHNGGRVQINAIGVGSDFIKDKDNPKYKFLSTLSEENGGFFVGF